MKDISIENFISNEWLFINSQHWFSCQTKHKTLIANRKNNEEKTWWSLRALAHCSPIQHGVVFPPTFISSVAPHDARVIITPSRPTSKGRNRSYMLRCFWMNYIHVIRSRNVTGGNAICEKTVLNYESSVAITRWRCFKKSILKLPKQSREIELFKNTTE